MESSEADKMDTSSMDADKIEVTVKTMDSGQQSFELDKEMTVTGFKEIITEKMDIPLERQRLIFQGKVLKDDKKLSEYGVAGKVVHLVQKAPPSASADGSADNSTSTTADDDDVTTATSSQFIVGTIPLRNPSSINPASITQHIAQHIAGQIAAATSSSNVAMTTNESNVSTATSQPSVTSVASDGAGAQLPQIHSLLTQAHNLLQRCKQHLDQFDQQSGANILQLLTSLSKGEQPVAMSTSEATQSNCTTTATTDSSATTATDSSSDERPRQHSYGSVLLADIYDDMATVNRRLSTLQTQWATIVRYDVKLEDNQNVLVNKLLTTIRTCQAHMTHVEVCTMRLKTQLGNPPPHVVELVDTGTALAGLLQPSSEQHMQIGSVSITSQTYAIPQALLAHMGTAATPTSSGDINQQLGGVISQVLGSMMESTPTTSTAGTTVTTSAASNQPVVTPSTTSQPAVVSTSEPTSGSQSVVSTSEAATTAASEEVKSKLPGDTPPAESQSGSNDQVAPSGTTAAEGSLSDNKVVPARPGGGSGAGAGAGGEERRPRLTIRLVHRPRGAPRSSILDSDSDDDNTITINLNSDSDDEISDQPSGVETRDADGNLTTEYRAMLGTLQRRQERRERQLVNILQHRRREIQNRDISQRLAQLTEGLTPPTNALASAGDGGESSSDEEMDPQEALAAVRRLTRSLLPIMLGPQGQLTIHDLWMDIQANRGPDWVPPDQTVVSHLLEYVARGLTVAQLFEIFSGSAEPMQGLHPYLLEFVREKLLDNDIPSPHNKQIAINTLMEKLQDYIDKIAEPVKVHPGINLRETINNCLKYSLGDVYDVIINKPEGEQAFGQALWGWCVNMAARVAAVTRHCMDGSEEEFQDVLRSFFTRTRDHGDEDENEEGMGVTPMSAFFTVSMVRRLNNFIEHCNFTQEDFDKFVVREPVVNGDQPGPSGTAPTEANKVSMESASPEPTTEQPVAMDTTTTTSISGEQWPTNMPQEWIPIIQYDIQYMEENQSEDQEVPLSDAYMSGMPAKRRKVEKKAQSMSQVLKDCLHVAVTKTAVTTTSGIDVVKEIGNQQQLSQALGEELYLQTRQRLKEDKNYQPDRYPNAERYYRPHN